MKRAIQTLTASFILVFMAGCAPEPSMVCQHYMEVFGDAPEKPAWLDNEDKCVDRMENVKNRHGVNSYRREVECALASDTSYKLRKCIKKETKKRGGPKV